VTSVSCAVRTRWTGHRPRDSSPRRSTSAPTPAVLSAKSLTQVKIPIDPIVHTFRPGTELRVVISAPGGDRPAWEFDRWT